MVHAPTTLTAWKEENVHHWSPAMREVINTEYPRLCEQSKLYFEMFDKVVEEIASYYHEDPMVKMVLAKMVGRKQVTDMDLCGVMPAGLLALIWIEYIKRIDEKECYDLFQDTLLDMSQTCVQGDSHRLFTILVALDRGGK
ncbi:MAG: hypothetical protein P4L69_13480 [Desulfosporosinus sp.]|nr:hypothetical protein [Desulfosporosinus sp.]